MGIWQCSVIYLLVLSSWKVNIAENPIAVMGLWIRSSNVISGLPTYCPFQSLNTKAPTMGFENCLVSWNLIILVDFASPQLPIESTECSTCSSSSRFVVLEWLVYWSNVHYDFSSLKNQAIFLIEGGHSFFLLWCSKAYIFHSVVSCLLLSLPADPVLYTVGPLLGGMHIKFIGNSFVIFYTKDLPL